MITIRAKTRFGKDTARFGKDNASAFRLDVDMKLDAPITALVGPSGAGKTSILNLIAGLLAPDSGVVSIGNDVWLDTQNGINLRPHRRDVGYVFQDGRLFPHLSVAANLDYGRSARGLSRDAAEEARIVAMLDIAPLMQRRPGTLSGGERQRVAIGRALMARPCLLLLDEPLAGLDPERKAEIAPYFERLRDHAGVPMIYVSHDASEVARLGASIVPVSKGRAAT